MKAKVISTGEIVEVVDYDDSKVTVYRNDTTEFFAQNEYRRDEIEFLPDTLEEVTMEGWVCRDGTTVSTNPILYLYLKGEPFPDYEPERLDFVRMWRGANGLHLPHELFPSVTWLTEPKRVKITITPME